MIDEFVNYFFGLTINHLPFGNYLYCTIRTGNLTGRTSCTSVFIIFIMRKNNFTPEFIKHLKCSPVLRILLCDYFFWPYYIVAGDGHPFQQGADPVENAFYVC